MPIPCKIGPCKIASAAAAAGLLAAVAAAPASAQDGRYAYPPIVVYSPYQAPDGTYNSLADFSRDVWGVPCGIECTMAAQRRWSAPYYPPSYR